MQDSPFPLTFSSTSCPACEYSMPPLSEILGTYFESGNAQCTNCGHSFDLWEQVRSHAGTSVLGLPMLGAPMTFFHFDLSRGETKELDFTQFGVPDGATILGVNYTPQGGDCFPVEFHGNTPFRQVIGTKVILYGVPIPDREGGPPVAIAATWVNREEPTPAWQCLTDAFEAVASRQFMRVILPSHTAVELTLMPLMSAILSRHASKTRVSNFLKNGLTYSHALNVVLPFACSTYGLPKLSDTIRGELNKLRVLRNTYVHEGITEEPSEDIAGNLLCAAVFGFHYLRYIRVKLTDLDAIE